MFLLIGDWRILRRLIALGTLVVGILGNQGSSANTNVTTTSTVVPVTTTTVSPRTIADETLYQLIPPTIISEWSKVAQCETGTNWVSKGPIYSGGLGITNINWIKFGGGQFTSNASEALPIEQISIAIKIEQGAGLGNYVPDQYGCGYGW